MAHHAPLNYRRPQRDSLRRLGAPTPALECRRGMRPGDGSKRHSHSGACRGPGGPTGIITSPTSATESAAIAHRFRDRCDDVPPSSGPPQRPGRPLTETIPHSLLYVESPSDRLTARASTRHVDAECTSSCTTSCLVARHRTGPIEPAGRRASSHLPRARARTPTRSHLSGFGFSRSSWFSVSNSRTPSDLASLSITNSMVKHSGR